MSYLDTADCVSRVKMRLNRPSTDEAFTVSTADDVIYDALTATQGDLILEVAPIAPDSLWSAPAQLTTADSGLTYTFGTTSGFPASFTGTIAVGHIRLYSNQASIPDYPLVPGVDFTLDGVTIRMPNHTARTFSDGAPWGQWAAFPATIASGTEPTLPMLYRPALVSGACAKLAKFRLGQDPSEHEAQYERDKLNAITAARTQVAGQYGQPLARRTEQSFRRALGQG